MKIKSLNIPCKEYRSGNPSDGYEYECEYYDQSGQCVECEDCVCNLGDINPINGKRINFLLRFIQKRRASEAFLLEFEGSLKELKRLEYKRRKVL